MSNQQVGRLAMRVEGDNWVAYFAMPGTMDGAIWLGSIRMAIVRDPDRKREFMNIMKSVIADMLEEKYGPVATWNETPAPESERAGRA